MGESFDVGLGVQLEDRLQGKADGNEKNQLAPLNTNQGLYLVAKEKQTSVTLAVSGFAMVVSGKERVRGGALWKRTAHARVNRRSS